MFNAFIISPLHIVPPFYSIIQGYLGKEGEILDGMDGVPVFFDEGGKRWFMTGDIGECDSEGIR